MMACYLSCCSSDLASLGLRQGCPQLSWTKNENLGFLKLLFFYLIIKIILITYGKAALCFPRSALLNLRSLLRLP